MEVAIFFSAAFFIGIILIGLGVPLRLGKIKPDGIYGFRTRRTLSDSRIWYSVNKFAGKAMIMAGIFIVLSSSVMILLRYSGIFDGEDLIMISFFVMVPLIFLPVLAMTIASFIFLNKLK